MSPDPGRRRRLDELVGGPPAPAAPPPAAAPSPPPGLAGEGGPGRQLERPAAAPVILPGLHVDVHRAVLAAYVSAQQDPGEWGPYGVRLPADLARQLKEQLAEDRIRTRLWRLAATHYIQAALSALPFGDPGKCAQVGREWRATRPLGAAGSVTSPGTRLRRDTREAMLGLSGQLSALPGHPPVQDVAAGALAALLAGLENAPLSPDNLG